MNAPIGWVKTCLGEIADGPQGFVDGPFGSNLPASEYVPCGVPVIRGSNLTMGELRFREDEFVFVSEEMADRLSRSEARPDDIILTKKGTLGQVGLVPRTLPYPRFLVSSNQMRLRVDRRKADSLFVYLWLSQPHSRMKVLRDSEATGVPKTNLEYFRKFPIVLPPRDEQQAIAQILGSFDDKIDLNRRMNRTLETKAQALFRSWFVEFNPVRARTEGRRLENIDAETMALFPSRFVDSELGRIPEGWRATSLNEAIDFVIGGDWGKEAPSNAEPVRAYCIRGADIPALQAGDLGAMPARFLKQGSVSKRELRAGDLVVEISGGSPTQSTGRVVLISDTLLREVNAPVVCSNFCRLVRPKRGLSYFLYLWFRWLYDRGALFEYETGTTGIKNFGFTVFAEKRLTAIPPDHLLAAFDRTVSSWFALQSANGINSRTLVQIRDTLLPKLLSGEIRVGAAEAKVTEST